jgi:threonine/homoserine/homoserine lactone efflux protein
MPEIVKSLRRQPLLLFGLGAAIVLIAAGSILLDDQRSITIPVLVILGIAAIGWIALEAIRASRKGDPGEPNAVT